MSKISKMSLTHKQITINVFNYFKKMLIPPEITAFEVYFRTFVLILLVLNFFSRKKKLYNRTFVLIIRFYYYNSILHIVSINHTKHYI